MTNQFSIKECSTFYHFVSLFDTDYFQSHDPTQRRRREELGTSERLGNLQLQNRHALIKHCIEYSSKVSG